MAYHRDPYIDFLKGIAILLVVFGHSIQYSNGAQGDFFQNPVFKFIYMFHMPLFALLSGYVSSNTYSRPFSDLFINKIRQLFIPSIVWLGIGIIIDVCFYMAVSGQVPQYIFFYSRYWFINSIILCSFISWGGVRLLGEKHNIPMAIFACFFVLLLPNFAGEEAKMFKFIFPFYILGYLINVYKSFFCRFKNHIGIISIIIFVVLYYFWKPTYFIYTSNDSIYDANNITHVLMSFGFRLIAGISGSAMVIYLFSFFYKLFIFNKIHVIGIYTFGIYMIQTIIFCNLSRIASYLNIQYSPIIYNILVVPIICVLVTLSCIYLIQILNRNKFLAQWTLGRKITLKSYNQNA